MPDVPPASLNRMDGFETTVQMRARDANGQSWDLELIASYNGAKTVNVYLGERNIDCFTYMETPEFSDEAGLAQAIQERYADADELFALLENNVY